MTRPSALLQRRASLAGVAGVPWIVLLWTAFIAAHLLVAWLGFVEPNEPRGDVYNVYDPWSLRAIEGFGIVGVTEPWVYPPVALVPMILARIFAPILGYQLAWVVVMMILDAVAFWVLIGNGSSASRRFGAWFWMGFLVALGPIALYRIDAATVPIAIVALLVIRRHPVVASALLAIGAWIKIWPGALLAAAFAAFDRKRQYVEGTLVVSGVVVFVVLMGGGIGHLFGFMTTQSDRGLQAESVFATPFLWGDVFNLPGYKIDFNAAIITFQVQGVGTDVVAALLTPLLLIVAAVLTALGWFAHRRGVAAQLLFPPLALALTVAFIVFNKVGSPQFQTWLIAPVVLWIIWDRRRALPYAYTALVIAAATHVLYPVFYNYFVVADPVIVTVISVRNLLLVAVLVATTTRVVQLALRGPTPAAVA